HVLDFRRTIGFALFHGDDLLKQGLVGNNSTLTLLRRPRFYIPITNYAILATIHQYTAERALDMDQARRSFLGQASLGLGSLALASIMNEAAQAAGEAKWPGAVRPLHHPARARRVIFLCMAGGPSHLETFDNKPKLAGRDHRLRRRQY
ncbi:MAG TPA: DUF1501 domain-containing protein, partial [Pirellulales bacterium]|nr:DUF1501 domain-containing protein [Pirellulales bacterium]